MNILPPLKVIKAWRDEGLSPTEVYQRCEKFIKPKRTRRIKILLCPCGNKHMAKGLCRKCYDRVWRESLKVKNVKQYVKYLSS